MKLLALKFYEEGYNCSQCIVKAFEEKFGVEVDEKLYEALNAVNTGFGIGSFCSALAGGIIVFGIVFDDKDARRARIRLIDSFYSYFGSLNCSGLNESKNKNNGCAKVIAMAAFFTEMILREEGFLPKQKEDI